MSTSLNIPTQKSVGHDSHAASIDNFNRQMRAQPFYADWFQKQGLDPNHVHLNQAQRQALQQVVLQQPGIPADAFNDMKIDPAGNLNTEHGFASQPTWLKAAEIGGAAAAGGYFAAPLFSSAAAPLGAGEASTTLTATGGIVPGAASMTGMTSGVTGTAAPGLMSHIASMAKNPAQLLSAGGRAVGAMANAAAANRGTTIDATMAHDELQLRAEQERRAAETDAYRKNLFGQLAAGYQPSQRPPGADGHNPNGFITPEARQSGQLMSDIAMGHVRAQDYPSITPLSKLPMKPGLMERIAGYAAPALQMFDPRLYGAQQR